MPSQPVWAAPRNVALLIAGYLLVHLGVRIWMGPTLGLDDAEQALFAQHWLPNYRFRAPPLFTWVLVGVSQIGGVGMLAISLMRYALLAMILGFTYLTARRLIRDPVLAALATFSFAAIYVFGYYSHHDLTHTTTLSAFLAASWYVFVRLAEAPSLRWYLALGVCFGLGMLGKWNFALFALALTLACLARPVYRRLVLDWRVVAAALLAAAIALPSVVYALRVGPATGDSAGALLGRQAGGSLLGLLQGTFDLALAAVTYPLPFLAIFLMVLGTAAWRGFKTPEPATAGPLAPDSAFVGTSILVAVGLHWLLVPLAGATDFDERLLQPALQILPIYLFMLVDRGGASSSAVRTYARLVAAVVVVALAARIGIHAAGADACRRICRALVPFGAIASDLGKAGFRGKGTIVVSDVHLAGNLRVLFPGARIMEIGYPPRVWPRASGNGQCLAVWLEERGSAGRAAVSGYLSRELHVDDAAPQREGTIAAAMPGSKTRSYRIAYRLYDGPQGDCR